MCVSLGLAPKLGSRSSLRGDIFRRRGRITKGDTRFLRILLEVPSAYDTVPSSRIPLPVSVHDLGLHEVIGNELETNNIEWSASTASPFTPRRCPPGEFASGKTMRDTRLGEGGEVGRGMVRFESEQHGAYRSLCAGETFAS